MNVASINAIRGTVGTFGIGRAQASSLDTPTVPTPSPVTPPPNGNPGIVPPWLQVMPDPGVVVPVDPDPDTPVIM